MSVLSSTGRQDSLSRRRKSWTNLSLGGDDLAFTNTLALGGHGQRLLQLLAEDDILDEHRLDLNTPTGRDILDDLANALGDLLTALDDVLQDTGTDDVAQGGLGTLDQGLADVGDSESGLVRADDVVVDDAGEVEVDIVLGHAHLLGDLDDLDLDVDLDKALGQGVDLNQTRVNCLVEFAELSDKADVTLADVLIGVGAADAARDRAEGSHAGAEGVDYRVQTVSTSCGRDGRWA